jgi:hypothetical protein
MSCCFSDTASAISGRVTFLLGKTEQKFTMDFKLSRDGQTFLLVPGQEKKLSTIATLDGDFQEWLSAGLKQYCLGGTAKAAYDQNPQHALLKALPAVKDAMINLDRKTFAKSCRSFPRINLQLFLILSPYISVYASEGKTPVFVIFYSQTNTTKIVNPVWRAVRYCKKLLKTKVQAAEGRHA